MKGWFARDSSKIRSEVMLRSNCHAPLDEDNIHPHRTHTRTSHSQLFFLLFFSFFLLVRGNQRSRCSSCYCGPSLGRPAGGRGVACLRDKEGRRVRAKTQEGTPGTRSASRSPSPERDPEEGRGHANAGCSFRAGGRAMTFVRERPSPA